jgi:MFS family permease
VSAAQEVQPARYGASYRGLFAQPVLRRLALADACARLPQGMVSITLLLVAAQHASMTVAGLVVAGYTLGQATTGPLRGRLADRHGLVPVAAPCTLGYALTLLVLLAASAAAAPAGLLVGTATAAGLLNPPLSPGMRSLWSRYAGARLSETAFALDAAVFDLAYITGPVLASGLATGLDPAAAVVVLLALTTAAVVAVAAPARRPGRQGQQVPAGRRSHRSPLRSAALRELLVTAALTNAALSATEVALTAYARHHDALWASGPLLAEVSLGSILGSLLLGAQAGQARQESQESQESQGRQGRQGRQVRQVRQVRRLRRLLTGYTIGLAVLTIAGLGQPYLLAVAAPLAGLCLGPTLATLFGSAAAAAPRGSGTETQAWVNSIMNGGAAGGAAIAGFAAGRPVLALGLAAAMAAAATISAAVGPARSGWSARSAVRSGKRETGAQVGGTAAPAQAGTGGQAMSSWTPQRVLDAAAGMEWVPEGAIEMRTDDYRLIRYPDVVLDPTFRAAQVTWSRTARSPDEVLDEVVARVREWGLPGVAWWVSAATEPAGTEQALSARGADLIDAVEVLALEIGAGLPQLDVPADVAVELVRDERTFHAASAVTVQGWERAEPDEVELAHRYQEAIADLASWSSFRVVAIVDNEPVSTGGCSLAGEVAQLWGAVTLPAARGRGGYRAVLAERLRLAREHGATLALVKGRVLTSGPILLRAGFADYGEERCYWLPTS